MDVRLPATVADDLRDLLQLLARARDEHHLCARLTDLDRRLATDTAGRSGDDNHLATYRLAQRALAEQIRIEIALPVVPQPPRVGVERRDGDAGALERGLGFA